MLTILEDEYDLCHSEAHDLGKVIYKKTQDISKSLELCRDGCTGGCFHGTLMEAFLGLADHEEEDSDPHVHLDDITAKINEICANPDVSQMFRMGNCAHGVGHAFAFMSEYDITKALNFCKLFEDERLTFYCSGGVFMEYDIVHGKSDLASHPLDYPCDTFTQYPAACYRYRAKHLMREFTTWKNYATHCMEKQKFERIGCFHGLGFTNIDIVFQAPHRVRQICTFGDLHDQRACLDGAIEKLADYDASRAQKACDALEGELHNFCEDAIWHKLYSLDKSFDLYLP